MLARLLPPCARVFLPSARRTHPRAAQASRLTAGVQVLVGGPESSIDVDAELDFPDAQAPAPPPSDTTGLPAASSADGLRIDGGQRMAFITQCLHVRRSTADQLMGAAVEFEDVSSAPAPDHAPVSTTLKLMAHPGVRCHLPRRRRYLPSCRCPSRRHQPPLPCRRCLPSCRASTACLGRTGRTCVAAPPAQTSVGGTVTDSLPHGLGAGCGVLRLLGCKATQQLRGSAGSFLVQSGHVLPARCCGVSAR